MKALIDSDILTYMVGFTTEDTDVEFVPSRVDTLVNQILEAVQADEHQLYLTMDGADGFRYKVDPTYKGHRKQEKPRHYDFIRTYMVETWGAKLVSNIEADDAMGIAQYEALSTQGQEHAEGYETIICSLDKDLDMIEGMHYRWPIIRKGVEVKPARFYTVEEPDATRWFFKQMLMGDTSDNIKGVRGVGTIGADKLLNPLDEEKEMFDAVRGLYADDERMKRNGQLLWIHRKENDNWLDRYERIVNETNT